MNHPQTPHITALAQSVLPDESFFVVDVSVSASRIKTKVTVLVDSDTGIGIDECASVSRQLADILETTNVFDTPYTLEVSSPGVDFPLKTARQFRKNINRKLNIKTAEAEVIGQLLEATETHITLQPDTPKKSKTPPPPEAIPYEKIETATVLVSFK